MGYLVYPKVGSNYELVETGANISTNSCVLDALLPWEMPSVFDRMRLGMTPLKYHFLLLSLTGYSRQLGGRRVLFFDPFSEELHTQG